MHKVRRSVLIIAIVLLASLTWIILTLRHQFLLNEARTALTGAKNHVGANQRGDGATLHQRIKVRKGWVKPMAHRGAVVLALQVIVETTDGHPFGEEVGFYLIVEDKWGHAYDCTRHMQVNGPIPLTNVRPYDSPIAVSSKVVMTWQVGPIDKEIDWVHLTFIIGRPLPGQTPQPTIPGVPRVDRLDPKLVFDLGEVSLVSHK